MISYLKAIETIKNLLKPNLGIEQVELTDALNRVLAQDLLADTDMPPFDKSAMDGYACKRADLKMPLLQIENIPAGKAPAMTVAQGQCSQIMTGAKVPDGADCVVMKEDVVFGENHEIIFQGKETNNNICYQAEDLKKGDLVLAKGTLIQAQELAILASFGCMKPLVYRKPEVGILCSGTELIEPHEQPTGVSIRNSNAYQLIGQVAKSGARPNYFGIVADDVELLNQKIDNILATSDVLIVTGGASVGDFDFIHDIFVQKGFDIHFTKVAMQPGKPVIFASLGSQFFVGLSGNPVSSFLQFELFVKPLLAGLSGSSYQLPMITAVAGHDLKRKKKGRSLFLPVKFATNGTIEALSFHGSAHLAALSGTKGFAIIPEDQERIEKGQAVQVLLINN